jgi:hypothetical protein
LSHAGRAVSAAFDDPNLVSCAGLVPVMRLAEQVDLAGLVAMRVRADLSTGSNPGGKAAPVVAGMAAGADSIDDLDVLRHGGMGGLFASVYAPSTLGSFLRRHCGRRVRLSAGRVRHAPCSPAREPDERDQRLAGNSSAPEVTAGARRSMRPASSL